jgi:hypothetical protein
MQLVTDRKADFASISEAVDWLAESTSSCDSLCELMIHRWSHLLRKLIQPVSERRESLSKNAILRTVQHKKREHATPRTLAL